MLNINLAFRFLAVFVCIYYILAVFYSLNIYQHLHSSFKIIVSYAQLVIPSYFYQDKYYFIRMRNHNYYCCWNYKKFKYMNIYITFLSFKYFKTKTHRTPNRKEHNLLKRLYLLIHIVYYVTQTWNLYWKQQNI